MKAEIIVIGNEILNGFIVDTNSNSIANKLKTIGVKVVHVSVVADNFTSIKNAIENNMFQADIKIFTGGLGPTNDDITKETAAKVFHKKLVINESVLNNINNLFLNRNIKLTESNKKQALVLEDAVVFKNLIGTAPGFAIEKDNIYHIFIPAVPFELNEILNNEIIPFIRNLNNNNLPHESFNFLFQGIPESILFESISSKTKILEDTNYSTAFLPSPGLVKFRVIFDKELKNNNISIIQNIENQLYNLLANSYVGLNLIGGIVEAIDRFSLKQKFTVSIAESCTGGNISRLITEYPGVSKWFMGSIVSYSNLVKETFINVLNSTLEQYGAVSKEVAKEMACGVREKFGSDYAIAVSGIAGPTGETKDKPIGLVYIAVASDYGIKVNEFRFGNSPRNINIEKASQSALMMLYNSIRKL